MAFSFHLYYDSKTGIVANAKHFGDTKTCSSNPDRYYSLGWWQPSQNGTLPFVSTDWTINRVVYGKIVEIGVLPEKYRKS